MEISKDQKKKNRINNRKYKANKKAKLNRTFGLSLDGRQAFSEKNEEDKSLISTYDRLNTSDDIEIENIPCYGPPYNKEDLSELENCLNSLSMKNKVKSY